MCRLRNIALESVTEKGVTDGRTDDGQSDPYVSLCFAGDTKISVSQGSLYRHILFWPYDQRASIFTVTFSQVGHTVKGTRNGKAVLVKYDSGKCKISIT